MALVEENMSFTLTRQYHNLYLAKWKVFSVYASWQKSVIVAHIQNKERNIHCIKQIVSGVLNALAYGWVSRPTNSIIPQIFFLSNTLKPCNRQ